MRSTLIRFAIAGLASLALAASASADTILSFAIAPPNGTVTATSSGGNTTITTPAGGVLVNIGTFGNQPFIGQALMNYSVPLMSGATATSSGGVITQTAFGGTIAFTGVGGPFAGLNLLTAVFTGGAFSGPAGGNSASINASQPPSSVTFTSAIPQIQALINASIARNLTLGYTSLAPALSITGSQVTSFTAVPGDGSFATNVIPEPTSIVMASISVLAGLGCIGLRRFTALRA